MGKTPRSGLLKNTTPGATAAKTGSTRDFYTLFASYAPPLLYHHLALPAALHYDFVNNLQKFLICYINKQMLTTSPLSTPTLFPARTGCGFPWGAARDAGVTGSVGTPKSTQPQRPSPSGKRAPTPTAPSVTPLPRPQRHHNNQMIWVLTHRGCVSTGRCSQIATKHMNKWVMLAHTRRQAPETKVRQVVKNMHAIVHGLKPRLALTKTLIGRVSKGLGFFGCL